MIKEKMVELLLLQNLPGAENKVINPSNGKEIYVDEKKLRERFSELFEEFVEPYVIDEPIKNEPQIEEEQQ